MAPPVAGFAGTGVAAVWLAACGRLARLGRGTGVPIDGALVASVVGVGGVGAGDGLGVASGALRSAVSAAGGGAGSPSQGNRSSFARDCTPSGPLTHVVCPSVKAVQSSALRHSSSPPVVGCCASPVAPSYCA